MRHWTAPQLCAPLMSGERMSAFAARHEAGSSQKAAKPGRDHNPHGFTVWLTGAGVKRAFSYGATDEFGYKAVDKISTIYDLHATILHVLGIDHERLSFYHNGIERRLTDVHGEVIREVLT